MDDNELLAAAPRSLQPRAPVMPVEGEPMWPTPVVETLLAERAKMLREGFAVRGKRGQGACWTAATRVLNTTHARNFTNEQVRNKLKNLRTLIRRVRTAEAHPIPGRKAPKKPSYWDALLRHFGDCEGRGGVEAVSVSSRGDGHESDGNEGSDVDDHTEELVASAASLTRLVPLTPKTTDNGLVRDVECNESVQQSDGSLERDENTAGSSLMASRAGGQDAASLGAMAPEEEHEDSGSDAVASDQEQTATERREEERKWSLEAVESLLQERETFKNLFSDACGREEKAEAWHRVTRGVNAKHGRDFTTKQVKNKYGNLRAAYRRICDGDARYAATSTRAPKRPQYWSALVQHFGSQERSSEAVPTRLPSLLPENSRDEDASTEKGPHRRATSAPHASTGGDAIRLAGDSIREGLVALGEQISSAFASSVPAQHGVSPDEVEIRELVRQQTVQTKETLELLQRQARTSSRMNELLELQVDQNRKLLAMQEQQTRLQRDQTRQLLDAHSKLAAAISQLTDRLESRHAIAGERLEAGRHLRVRPRQERSETLRDNHESSDSSSYDKSNAGANPAAKRQRHKAG